MNIFDKIEEIRRQPEHVRLRWAWGLTAFGMVFILIIWMISFSAQFENTDDLEKENILNSQVIEDLSVQKESIQDATKQMKSLLEK
ncbi:MAG: hypothetical protein A2271_03815 [Candidatus Moranbacteria bacterium RIFOXYA12_FULL_35_19]|nr:MAG: hypothetical protein UR78_C0003G0034 [Candidatus Moranbacteria bacterium GW2011_GWF2_35_39]OGI33351.1 MAG: hypothetical protein A2489_03800 [Candidatus Moranbacteria bacterium RIFOXYC12_FULL_36_13]OGI36299.1 MAG: hypothetical protein A2271_03815 [Candidatus Moranbacteria bacterium RIFOXYA12_FULL_35_19]